MTDSTARGGMVTSLHHHASDVGAEILEQGGNAVDAAIATCLALNVVLPEMCGIGGEGRALLYMQHSGEQVVVDWGARSPSNAAEDMYELDHERDRVVLSPSIPLTGWPAVKENANAYGYRSPMVPGSIAGYALCLKRFGTMSLSDVMQPAIRLAEEGFEVTPELARHIGENVDLLSKFPASRQVFMQEGVKRYWDVDGPHLRLVQSDLSRTLGLIAAGGPDVFYRGEIAESIAQAMRENGGLITEKDLAMYEPEVLEPSRGTFGEYEVLGMPGGGTTVVQILNILNEIGLKSSRPDSPDVLHLLAEAIRLTFGDRVRYIFGDLDRVPWKGLCSREHAQELAAQVDQQRATPVSVQVTSDPWSREPDTTHLCVVDGQRNVVSATITLGAAFGSRVVIPGTGILMNGLMASLSPEPGDINSVGPWKRRRSPHAGTIIMKDGAPYLALGSPGGEKQIVATAQVILNVLVGGHSMQHAIDMPRLFRGLRDVVYVSEDMPKDTILSLEGMGHSIQQKLARDFGFGRPNGILIDPAGRPELDGGVHGDSNGKASWL